MHEATKSDSDRPISQLAILEALPVGRNASYTNRVWNIERKTAMAHPKHMPATAHLWNLRNPMRPKRKRPTPNPKQECGKEISQCATVGSKRRVTSPSFGIEKREVEPSKSGDLFRFEIWHSGFF